MKKHILFVDDDVNSLRSLKRMLIKLSDQWDMGFVEEPEKALEMMAMNSYDVIVADMRMPKMTGAQLLEVVKEKYPGIVRIILSGHSNKNIIMNSIGPCHQFLAKPCRSDVLVNTVDRACVLRELLHDEKLKESLTRLEGIPSTPQVYLELEKEINSPDVSLKNVGKIIAKDVGLSAKILQLINSAFFGMPRHVSTVEQAVSLLGLDVINAIVLSSSIFSLFNVNQVKNFSVERLSQHNLQVANFAKAIMIHEQMDKKLCEQTFMAGLLHDVGELILASIYRSEYGEAIRTAISQEILLYEAELLHFNASHQEIGAYLLGLWGLPDPIIEVLAYHHQPGLCFDKEFSALTAVHCADYIHYQFEANTNGLRKTILDRDYIDMLSIQHKLSEWSELCEKLYTPGDKNE